MFIGHFAVGFAAKKLVPQLSLAALFAAAQLADLLWPFLLLLGVEQVRIDPGNTAFTPLEFVSYPVSHSLALLILWGIVFGVACRLTVGGKHVLAVIAGLVVSHWFLDVLAHRPDMPVYPGGPKLGLGLWNSVPATLFVELAFFVWGLSLYVRATRSRDARGRWGLVVLVVVLVVAYLANLSGAPPSVLAIEVVSIGGGLVLLVLSWFADWHRESRDRLAL